MIFSFHEMGLQKLIVGDQLVETEIQKRKIILGGYLTLLYLAVDLFFFLVNLFNPSGDPFILLMGFFIAGICLLLIRMGHINWALIIQFIRANAVAFYFCLVDENPYETAPFIYFIPSSLGALAIFGYQERWKGILFTMLSFTLFMIALFNPDEYTPNHAHFYFVTNFLIVLIIGTLILVFYDHLAFESEKKIIQKNKELVKANAELDRFVYSASHDLRAPLASILGLINVYSIAKDENEKDQLVNLMKGRVNKLDDFIQDILDYSRNARLELNKKNIVLEEFLHTIVEGLRYFDTTERIDIKVQVPPAAMVYTDPQRLAVICNNLLTNSIRYADLNKPNPYISLEILVEKNGWRLRVSDNGIGIKKQSQDKVFQMFYQANQHPEGTGLGLYIVQEAVQLLGGKIDLQSSFGEGTTITVHFEY